MVRQKLFRCVNDKRAIERDQPAQAVDVDVTDDDVGSGKSEAKKTKINPICKPVKATDDEVKAKKMEIDAFFGSVKTKAERCVYGFRNIKNSWYMNAVLQCLAHLDPMRQALMENFDANKLNL